MRYFKDNGLRVPELPSDLQDKLVERRKGLYATRDAEMSPYNIEYYIKELDSDPYGDYCILAHSGHGANSWALQYYLIYQNLELLIHKGWGGIYDNKRTDTRIFNQCVDIADRIVRHPNLKRITSQEQRLRIVATDFYESYWKVGDQGAFYSQKSNVRAEALLKQVVAFLDSRNQEGQVSLGLNLFNTEAEKDSRIDFENRYLGQLIGFNRNEKTDCVDIRIGVCPEIDADIYGRCILKDLRKVGSTRIYSMSYRSMEDGFELEPDEDFEECLLAHESYSDEDELEGETYRKVQTVAVVEEILEILRESNLVGIFAGESNL